jgi:hypothetical protein
MSLAKWLQSAVAIGAVVTVFATAAPVTADPSVYTPPGPTPACNAISPLAVPCVALNKGADAVAWECRRVGIPDQLCKIPLSYKVTQAATDAYLQSWVHRTAQFQFALGDPLNMVTTQWLGTHNSYNSLTEGFTPSHFDSNQQLSLTQQLDIDMRALELDLHYYKRLKLLGQPGVTVCHGLSPQDFNAGCTAEPLFTKVLPLVANWLNAPGHSNEVILLYLEDQLQNPEGYASAINTLDTVLRRPDGSSLIYRPDPSQRGTNGCVSLPPGLSRQAIRASNARVLIVGKCAPDWSSDVFDWTNLELESGSTPNYRAYPACDATYSPAVYATHLIRYYEDSTLVSAVVAKGEPPNNPDALTPTKVQAMTACGVNLYGFDQILPEDGRIQASMWSWAPDEPRAGGGNCTLQGADGRWVAAQCGDSHPAACVDANGTWRLTPSPVPFTSAASTCSAINMQFGLPRTGLQNSSLGVVAGPAGGAWVNYSIS